MKLNKHENNATNPFTWKGDKQCLTHIMIGFEIGLALIMNKTMLILVCDSIYPSTVKKNPFFFTYSQSRTKVKRLKGNLVLSHSLVHIHALHANL